MKWDLPPKESRKDIFLAIQSLLAPWEKYGPVYFKLRGDDNILSSEWVLLIYLFDVDNWAFHFISAGSSWCDS